MRIAVIGNGVVGHATARCYMENHEVRIWDKVDVKCSHSLRDVLGVGTDWKPEIVFVCLPESALDTFFFKFDEFGGRKFYGEDILKLNFVLKSTVPIGTTQRLREEYQLPNLVHSPEFLTERRAVTDAQCPAQNIIGWQFPGKEYVLSTPCGHILHDLYEQRFPGVPIRMMTGAQSEAVKLITNSFFGVKLAFFNEVHQLLTRMDIGWDAVLEGVLGDGRINHSHTQVPGPDGKFGFGGKCIPKDLEMLLAHVNEAEREIGVCAAAAFRNKAIDRNR